MPGYIEPCENDRQKVTHRSPSALEYDRLGSLRAGAGERPASGIWQDSQRPPPCSFLPTAALGSSANRARRNRSRSTSRPIWRAVGRFLQRRGRADRMARIGAGPGRGEVVHATGEFDDLAPPSAPVMPDGSPVSIVPGHRRPPFISAWGPAPFTSTIAYPAARCRSAATRASGGRSAARASPSGPAQVQHPGPGRTGRYCNQGTAGGSAAGR